MMSVSDDATRQEAWQKLIASSISFRQALHRKPELSWDEHNTAVAIRAELDAAGIAWRACAQTGTLATLAAWAEGPHIALRGDIDALPITEESGRPWSSEVSGCMHACGHDGHAAALMAAGKWLKLNEASLAGPVTLVFQPAEEGGHGAKKMIEQGALDGIDAIYGWHNWPAIPYGEAVCPNGPVMAANSLFSIEVEGVGGHASQPESCRDPVLAASAITLALQQIVARRLPPQLSAVVSVTSFDAVSAKTVIPSRAILAGGIRTSEDDARDLVNQLVSEVAESTALSYGCKARIEHTLCYGATVNHNKQAAHFRAALEQEFGEQWQSDKIATPIMASEDFSYFLKEIPGAFALIGTDDGQGHDNPCHSPFYDFNDQLIARVVSVYARIVGAPVPSDVAR